jgi:hypothetical protein
VGTTATSSGTRRPAVVAVVAVVAVAALVLVAIGRDGGPPVIRLGAAGTASDTMEAAADVASLTRLAYVEYRFELADGARFPAGEASAWRLEPPGDLEAATRELASQLGLEGEVASSPWDDRSLQVGSTDGSGPSLWVGPAGDWNFNDPSWLPEVRCVEAEPMPVEPDEGIGDGAEEPPVGEDDRDAPDARTEERLEGEGVSGDPGSAASGDDGAAASDELVDAEPCEPVEPPGGIPSEAEARAEADRFFAGLDLPATPRITEAFTDEWSAWVAARLPLAGADSDLHLSVSFGPEAVVTSANATLARPVEVGRYPTLDAEAAVARLEEQQAWALGGAQPRLGGTATTERAPIDPDAPADPATLADPDTPVEGPADAVDAAEPEPGVEDDEFTILPAPGPGGAPEVVTVTLVDAEPASLLTVDADGTLWLLPGVRFRGEDGGEWQVLTVADEYLDTTAADEPEPAPAPDEPAPGSGTGGDEEPGDPGSEPGPEPGREPGPQPDPDQPDQPDPIEPDTGLAEEVAHDVIGRSEEEAIRLIEDAGLVPRTVSRDGETFAVTEDYRTDRINLTVEQGRVSRADVG